MIYKLTVGGKLNVSDLKEIYENGAENAYINVTGAKNTHIDLPEEMMWCL